MTHPALHILRAHWWVLLIRGIAALLFGIVALFWPGLSAFVLLISFGIFAITDGVFALITAFRRKFTDDRWWSWLVDGLLSIIIGLMALFWPAATALALVYWIAAWAVAAGAMRIIAAIRLRREIEGEWALGLGGLLMVVWGALLAVMPATGILGLTWLIGSFAILIGITMIILALRLRRIV